MIFQLLADSQEKSIGGGSGNCPAPEQGLVRDCCLFPIAALLDKQGTPPEHSGFVPGLPASNASSCTPQSRRQVVA